MGIISEYYLNIYTALYYLNIINPIILSEYYLNIYMGIVKAMGIMSLYWWGWNIEHWDIKEQMKM